MNQFCTGCGNQLQPNQEFCTQCGVPQSQIPGQGNVNPQNVNQVQTQGVQWGWAVLGFFIPIVGWILWGVWKNTKPETARACGIAGCIGFVVNLLIFLS